MKRLNYSTTPLLGLTVYSLTNAASANPTRHLLLQTMANWSFGTIDVARGVWESCLLVKSEILKIKILILIMHSGPF